MQQLARHRERVGPVEDHDASVVGPRVLGHHAHHVKDPFAVPVREILTVLTQQLDRVDADVFEPEGREHRVHDAAFVGERAGPLVVGLLDGAACGDERDAFHTRNDSGAGHPDRLHIRFGFLVRSADIDSRPGPLDGPCHRAMSPESPQEPRVTSVPIDRVLEEVRRTLRRGDLVKSVGMVRELARQAGQDPRSRHLQAKLAIEFGQSREAVGMLETLVFEMTGDDLRDATIDLANARALQGDVEGGLTTIRPELEAEGETPAAAIAAAARLHALAGDDIAAFTLLDEASPADNEAHHIASARAAIALATRADHEDLAAREQAAIDALTAESERVGVPAAALMKILLDLGELLARKGEDAAAARAWKRSASLSPYKIDPRSYGQAVGGLLKSWGDANLSRARTNESGDAATSHRPLFVVGMPGGGVRFAADLLAASPEAHRSPDPEALTAAIGRHLAPANAGGQPVVPDPTKLSGKQLAGAAEHYLMRIARNDEALDDKAQTTRTIDAFERRYFFFQLPTIGIGKTAVNVALRFSRKETTHLLGIVEDEAGGGKKRRAVLALGRPGGLDPDRLGLEFHSLGFIETR